MPRLEVPIALDRDGAIPLTTQLVSAVRAAVLAGLLSPGSRMPSSRVLAVDLGVSRIVSTEAYARLVAEGYLETRHGSGTYVAQLDPALHTSPPPRPRRPGAHHPPSPEELAFRTGATARVGRHDVTAAALRIAARTPLPRHYLDAQGDAGLRSAIAGYLARSRGLAPDPDNIVVTTGSTQSTDLMLRCRTGPGDAVALEEPAHPALRGLIASHRLRIVPIPVDADGARVDRLGDTARLAHVTPSHQFPLGVRMSIARRLDLIAWARAGHRLILEDDYDSEYRYDGPPLPTLTALAPEHVSYLGTLSKVVSPTLRCGYLVAPPEIAAAVTEMKDLIDGPLSLPLQHMLRHLLESGDLERHIRRTRLRYARVRSALHEAVKPYADLVTLGGSDSGLHAVLYTRQGISARQLADRARAAGLTIATLAEFYHGTPDREGLVLGYGALSEDEVRRACAVLIGALRER